MKISLVFILSIFIFGCASNLRVSEDYSFNSSDNEGLIVVSTRTIDKCRGISNSSVLMFGESSSYAEAGGIFFENSFLANDFENPPGYFLVKSIPAGKYKFTRLVKTGVMVGAADMERYNMTFIVKPNKIQYLGEIHANISTCSTVKVSIKDQRKRDRKIFDQRMKKLKSSDFEFQIMKTK